MKRQKKSTVLQANVLQPQEDDLGGRRHGHEVHSSFEVGHVAGQNDQHEKAKNVQCTTSECIPTPRVLSWWRRTWP